MPIPYSVYSYALSFIAIAFSTSKEMMSAKCPSLHTIDTPYRPLKSSLTIVFDTNWDWDAEMLLLLSGEVEGEAARSSGAGIRYSSAWDGVKYRSCSIRPWSIIRTVGIYENMRDERGE